MGFELYRSISKCGNSYKPRFYEQILNERTHTLKKILSHFLTSNSQYFINL
ncbi:hypothetical protein LEP1GSC074_3799 [Leptospira noguchii str. Hook]|nr:hypothetical protein LEP1GSC074_3799 [Leptospira noguchii str. Hook]